MTFKTVNPADGSALKEVAVFTAWELETALQGAAKKIKKDVIPESAQRLSGIQGFL